MDVFKTKIGENRAIPINEENYIRETNCDVPFVVPVSDKKDSYFAVCPICENPIQIIGLFKREEESMPRSPYGRHSSHPVHEVGVFDRDAYLACPFRRGRDADRLFEKRPTGSETSNALYQLLRDQFDRIVYIWNKTVPVYMSRLFARELLEYWVGDEGWRYYDSTYFNLPYMLFFPRHAYSLIGRLVREDSEFCKRLRSLDAVELEQSSKRGWLLVRPKGKQFVKLTFYSTRHHFEVVDEHLEESFDYVLCHEGEIICTERVWVDQDYLGNLMAKEGTYRDQALLDIAKEVMG